MANSTKVKAGQTLLDVAIQKHGTAAEIFEVARLNGRSITDDLQSGQAVNYGDAVVIDVAAYFAKYDNDPASAASNQVELINTEGIDFWALEFDFIVS